MLHVITSLNQGGAENALLRLISSMLNNIQSQHVHHVISLTDTGMYGDLLNSLNCQVHVLAMKRGKLSIRSVLKLRKLMQKINPDVVQTWMYHADLLGGVVAKSLRIPVFWGVRHNDTSMKSLGIKTWLVAKMCALVSAFVPDKIVSCSRSSIASHREFGYSDCFVYIPNGFDISKADYLEVESQTKTKTMPVVGHAARFHPFKGHIEFVTALLELKRGLIGFRARMAGFGVCFSNPIFSCLVSKSLHEDIDAIGPQADMADFYMSCDVFVLSSLGEGFPNVVAEAMLFGLPCIVTDVGDAAEIVGDTGWVVRPGDIKELKFAIQNALAEINNIEDWLIRKAKARTRIADNYSIEKMQAGYTNIWQSVKKEVEIFEK